MKRNLVKLSWLLLILSAIGIAVFFSLPDHRSDTVVVWSTKLEVKDIVIFDDGETLNIVYANQNQLTFHSLFTGKSLNINLSDKCKQLVKINAKEIALYTYDGKLAIFSVPEFSVPEFSCIGEYKLNQGEKTIYSVFQTNDKKYCAYFHDCVVVCDGTGATEPISILLPFRTCKAYFADSGKIHVFDQYMNEYEYSEGNFTVIHKAIYSFGVDPEQFATYSMNRQHIFFSRRHIVSNFGYFSIESRSLKYLAMPIEEPFYTQYCGVDSHGDIYFICSTRSQQIFVAKYNKNLSLIYTHFTGLGIRFNPIEISSGYLYFIQNVASNGGTELCKYPIPTRKK